MILADKNIKEKGCSIINSGYNSDNVGAISYDLTLDYVIDYVHDEEVIITPNSTLIIRTKEELNIPSNLLGRIAEKNSVMRMGLLVRGPHYQPGHKTHCFLFVTNISPNEIKLRKGMKIAQIIFEQLLEEPDITYDNNPKASFNNELDYKGFGKYEKEYNTYINKISDLSEDLSSRESQIYSNILTFMGIFVSIFSLITINFEIITRIDISLKSLISINLSIVTVLVIFMSLILFVVNKQKGKHDKKIACVTALVLILVNILLVFL